MKTPMEKQRVVDKLLSGHVRPDGVIVESTEPDKRTDLERLSIIKEMENCASKEQR